MQVILAAMGGGAPGTMTAECAGALAAAGKETAYAAQVLCGTVDHMQMTQIVIMRYGARDKGTVLYALNADQYIKP